MNVHDRVGLGWREALATATFAHLDDIEVIEILAEDYWRAPVRALRGLKSLGRERPLLVHGVTLGAACAASVDAARLERLARLIDRLEPALWSEHLAFVRAGGYEIGHLAAPPRNWRTLEATAMNWQRMRQLVGQTPAAENVATLIDPPDSELSEAEWMTGVLEAAAAPALLDLHNLYVNAVNFGHEPLHYLEAFPLARVRIVHISGGRWINCDEPKFGIKSRRMLDDHLHDVPDPVFRMLEYLGRHCPHPLQVILERDGNFPDFDELLGQLRRARQALSRGRSARTSLEADEFAAV